MVGRIPAPDSPPRRHQDTKVHEVYCNSQFIDQVSVPTIQEKYDEFINRLGLHAFVM